MSHVTLKIEFAALAHNTPIPTYTHMCTCNIYVWKLTAYLSVFQISCEHIAFDCIHVSDILHSCVGLDVSQTHQVHVFMLMCLRHIKFTHVTWLIFYPWHDLFIHTCDMTHSYLSHDLFIRMIWPLPKCNLNYWVQRDVCQSGGYLTALVQCVVQTRMKPIADTVAQNFEIISEKHESSTRRGF